jgi:hypothetical protein
LEVSEPWEPWAVNLEASRCQELQQDLVALHRPSQQVLALPVLKPIHSLHSVAWVAWEEWEEWVASIP